MELADRHRALIQHPERCSSVLEPKFLLESSSHPDHIAMRFFFLELSIKLVDNVDNVGRRVSIEYVLLNCGTFVHFVSLF